MMTTPFTSIKLERICKFINGGTPSKNIEKYYKGTIPWITGADISDDTIQEPRHYITQEAIQNSATNIIPSGNILLVTRTGVGKVAITTEDICISQDFTGLIPDYSKVDLKYLYYYLKSSKRYFERNQRGATIKGVTRDVVKNLDVPIPHSNNPVHSLISQRQIVARIEALLAEVREMREINQTIQSDVDRVMDAVYEETYPDQHSHLPEGWEIKTLSDVCLINPRRPQIRREANTATSFVPMAAVDEKTGAIVDLQVKPYFEVRTGFTYFEENDVIFAKITPSMQNGKAAIARGLLDGFGFGSTEFHVFRANQGILPDWIYHYIRRMRFRKEAMQRFRGAAGQKRVPQDFLEMHIIPVPFPNDYEKSITTQKRLIAYFDAMMQETIELHDIALRDSDHLDQLEKAILVQAFRGEL